MHCYDRFGEGSDLNDQAFKAESILFSESIA